MASIYKQSRKKPIPAGAEIVERQGRRLARWTDPKTNCKRTAPLSDDGTRIIVEAKWHTIAYFDHTGRRVEVGSKTPDYDAAKTLAAKLETNRRTAALDALPSLTFSSPAPNPETMRATGTDGPADRDLTTYADEKCQQNRQQSIGESVQQVATGGESKLAECTNGDSDKPLVLWALGGKRPPLANDGEMGRGGIEPPTHGFSVRCSTD